MITVQDLNQFLNKLAPVSMRIQEDNVGLLVGRRNAAVTKVLVALDITREVIREAVDFGAELIVAHHPVIFQGVARITDKDYTGERLLMLIENRIAAICMHTNLDVAKGGVNDALAGRIGLNDIQTIIDPSLSAAGDRGVCRMGTPQETMHLDAFARHVKQALRGNGVKVLSAERPVQKVAVGGGSCGSDIPLVVAAGCDTFVTSDIKHSQMLEAKWYGLNLIDAGHFPTEDVISSVLVQAIADAFPALQVRRAESLTDPMMYIGDEPCR